MLFKLAMSIPILNILVEKVLRSKVEEIYNSLNDMLFVTRKEIYERVPLEPVQAKHLEAKLEEIYETQLKVYGNCKHSGTIYHSEDKNLNGNIEHAMQTFSNSNSYDPESYKGVAHMQADIVNCTIKLFNGDADTHGMLTSGGTESILSCIASYKLFGLKEKGITHPNIVAYDHIHAAFWKACDYFGIEIRIIESTLKNYNNPETLRQHIDSNTVAIISSGCNYAHGGIDDIVEFGKLALEYKVGLHVDNCLGGFVNCFGEEVTNDMFAFDFRTPGVTSISVDTHKYGYGPKGMSVAMMRPKKLFDCLKYTSLDHAGTPATFDHLGDTRSGPIIAGTWAAMMSHGYKSYAQKVKKIYKTKQEIKKFVDEHPDIKLYGPNNSLNMVCFDGVNTSPIRISLKMKELSGWYLSECQNPCVVHFLVSDSNYNMKDNFIQDLSTTLDEMRKAPPVKESPYQKLYGASQMIEDQSLINTMLFVMIDAGYSATYDHLKVNLDTVDLI